jgi:hypothetical protein
MNFRMLRLLAIGLLAVCVAGWASPASAQDYTGRIDITVEDSTGARLPGVTVDLSGPFNQTSVTDSRGETRFLNLAPGTYLIKCALSGFAEYKSPNLPVTIGGSVPLVVKMGVAGAKETVVVTGEAPTIDTKKQGTSTTVNLLELQNVPTARDPWVVMQSVPGVVMDRVNVGGSESGQQSNSLGKGAPSGQTTWNVDGIAITDMASLSSTFYYDFDMFSEMNIATGGSDVKSATGGVQMNFMLKGGTNAFHGNGKFYYENESMQGTNVTEAFAKSMGSITGKGNRTDLFRDYGGDVGGPIFKDRWWFWGAYGNQDIRIITAQGVTDETFLKNASFKTQGQITKALRGSFTFFQADKAKEGRGNGIWTAADQGSTHNQSGFGGPNRMYKGELNFVAGSNLFLVARYAKVEGGFQLIPAGGSNTPTWIDAAGQSHGSAYTYTSARPQKSFVADGNYFAGKHELKFGFSWRKAEVHSTSTWANDYATDTYGAWLGYPVLAGTGAYPYMVIYGSAPYAADVASNYYSGYIGDTITLKKMTINLGLRYDRQIASVLPSTMKAASVPAIAAFIPEVVAPGVDKALSFGILQPRVGLTYSLGESRKTQLRATYAAFTNQIGAGQASFLSVGQSRYFYMAALDANGDKIAQPSELILSSYQSYVDEGYYGGYDPSNPTKVNTTSIHKVGNYTNPLTHEAIFGIDRELAPNLGVSASYTWRRVQNFNWRPIVCTKTTTSCPSGYIDGSAYTFKGTVTGALPSGIPGSASGTYSVPYYGLSSGVSYDPAKGTIYTERPNYHQSYQGFEISATKRMSNKWMARVGLSTNVWREYFGSNQGMGNPTPVMGAPMIDGAVVVAQSAGSGKSNIWMSQPKYQVIANGAYQLPFDFDLGFSYLLRQGYPMLWNYSTSGGFTDTLGSSKALLLVPQPDYARLPVVQTVDIRVGKRIRMYKTTLSIDFDVFNLLNQATELQREYRKTSSKFTNILETMQPRIARIGARFTF